MPGYMNIQKSLLGLNLVRLLCCYSMEALVLGPLVNIAKHHYSTYVTIGAGIFATAIVASIGYGFHRFGPQSRPGASNGWFFVKCFIMVGYWIAGVCVYLQWWRNVKLFAIVCWSVGDYLGNLIALEAVVRL